LVCLHLFIFDLGIDPCGTDGRMDSGVAITRFVRTVA